MSKGDLNKARLAKQWIEALESGRYNQARSYLTIRKANRHQSHCCLGVACNIAIQNGIKVKATIMDEGPDNDNHAISYDGRSGDLPPSVRKAIGLRTSQGMLEGNSLVDLNDDSRYRFKRIAKTIRENIDTLFEPGVAKNLHKIL
jgi:hypothetical protein